MDKAASRGFGIVRALFRVALFYWFVRRSAYWFAAEVYYHMLAPLYHQAENAAERRSVLLFVGKWLLLVHRVVPRRLLRTIQDDAPIRVHGTTFYLGLESGEAQILREIYEHRLYDRRDDYIPRQGWTVIDVGANSGLYAVQQALRGARVYAFEPNPECFRRLSKSVEANGLADRVVAFDTALGAAAGHGVLVVSPDSTPGGAVEPTDIASEGEVAVRIDTLDHAISELGLQAIDLLKIDAEGSECDVLRGGERTLAIAKRVVLEYHSNDLLAQVTALLREQGFTPVLRVANTMGTHAGILYAERSGGRGVTA